MHRRPNRVRLLGGVGISIALLAVALRATAGVSGRGIRPPSTAPQTPVSGESRTEEVQLGSDDGRTAVSVSLPRGGFYAAPRGTELRYRVTAHQESHLSSTETRGSQSDFTLDLKATVVLRVLDRRGEECLASLAYLDSEASVTAGGRAADEATIASLEQEVARLVHLRIATEGTVTAWSFPADMPASVKQLERGLLDEMRFVVPSDAGAAWSTKESDASGLYSVEYARTREDGHNVDVGRRRATFTSQDESRTVTLEARIEDKSQASFDLSLGWFSQATCNEQTTVDVADAGVVVETRNIATWRLIESQHAPGSEELADWELPWVDDLGAVDRRQDDEERQRKRDEAAGRMDKLLAELGIGR